MKNGTSRGAVDAKNIATVIDQLCIFNSARFRLNYVMYVCMYVCMYVTVYACMCVYMYVCTYICMYVCIWLLQEMSNLAMLTKIQHLEGILHQKLGI